MASIIAAKSPDVQYAIVGKSQNLEKEVAPDYNVGFVGTGALDKFNAFFTYRESQGYSATAVGESFKDDGTLQARLFSMLFQLSKTGYVALTGYRYASWRGLWYGLRQLIHGPAVGLHRSD